MRALRRFTVRTVLPEALAPLEKLATNLRWSWHEPTRAMFESLDPEAWQRVHGDPLALLAELGSDRLNELATDASLVARVEELDGDLSTYMSQARWYDSEYDDADKPSAIAYFSAEYGITSVLPQYSGGLGILAGDHLKSASDLGIPVVGVGLLYGAGYFKQSLNREGWQQQTYPLIDPDSLPLTPLRDTDGSLVTVSLNLPDDRVLHAQIWIAQVGRVPLLLLDSNIADNDERQRSVTDRLYGGTPDHRLEQELLLGMGGIKAVREYSRVTGGPTPEVYHCNEGHAGFLAVERMRELIHDAGQNFETALETVRAGTVFTTHTPVPAGIDRFARNLVQQYFSGSAALEGLPVEKVLDLGAEDYEGGNPDVFNMALLALRVARRSNGVSKLHGKVSRGMFHSSWPGFDVSEVPITSVTNGVHGPTWVHPEFAKATRERLGDQALVDGEGWNRQASEGGFADSEIWALRNTLRGELIETARSMLRKSWLDRGASPAELGWTGDALDPDILTIGFARRVPTYKRLTLMLSDPERLEKLLTDPERPIQIIVAGKSHPDDEPGVGLIQRFVSFADQVGVRDRIVFLPNYDIAMAQKLMPGVDVWLNNPLRPLEASGTSGMKCALNGGLNLSILDGWWDEMYDGQNGWAIPTADGVEDQEHRDSLEAAALYELLEKTVVPRFYERDADGVPSRWIDMIRHTLSTLGPKVQATRQVRDYVEQLYTPVAAASRALDGDFAGARQLAEWKATVRSQWSQVRVDNVDAGHVDTAQVGDEVSISADVSLGALEPDDVAVQVVFGDVDDDDNLTNLTVSELAADQSRGDGRSVFTGAITLVNSGRFGYTVRVVPKHELLDNSAEVGLSTIA